MVSCSSFRSLLAVVAYVPMKVLTLITISVFSEEENTMKLMSSSMLTKLDLEVTQGFTKLLDAVSSYFFRLIGEINIYDTCYHCRVPHSSPNNDLRQVK